MCNLKFEIFEIKNYSIARYTVESSLVVIFHEVNEKFIQTSYRGISVEHIYRNLLLRLQYCLQYTKFYITATTQYKPINHGYKYMSSVHNKTKRNHLQALSTECDFVANLLMQWSGFTR